MHPRRAPRRDARRPMSMDVAAREPPRAARRITRPNATADRAQRPSPRGLGTTVLGGARYREFAEGARAALVSSRITRRPAGLRPAQPSFAPDPAPAQRAAHTCTAQGASALAA